MHGTNNAKTCTVARAQLQGQTARKAWDTSEFPPGPAAYWAAYCRCPHSACLVDAHGPACLRTASAARGLLAAEGWKDVPSWKNRACSPDRPEGIREPGEWRHGWQHCVAYTELLLPPAFTATSPPHSLAFQGRSACTSLTPETTRIALRRGLRLPLQLVPGRCGSS